jgi:hypothetical protein
VKWKLQNTGIKSFMEAPFCQCAKMERSNRLHRTKQYLFKSYRRCPHLLLQKCTREWGIGRRVWQVAVPLVKKINDVKTVFVGLVIAKRNRETVENTVAKVYAALKVVCRCPVVPVKHVLRDVRERTLWSEGLSLNSSFKIAPWASCCCWHRCSKGIVCKILRSRLLASELKL